MLCLSNLCDQQATFVVYWPGKTTYSCDKHARAQRGIADAMGMGLEIGKIEIKDGEAVVPLPPIFLDRQDHSAQGGNNG
jgi:hypothetical protein